MEVLGAALRAAGATTTMHHLSDPGDLDSVLVDQAEVVVVDAYGIRADSLSRNPRRRLVAIDDLDRDLAVDVLVDPSPGATAAPHESATRVLAGSRFALVDVAEHLPAARPVRGPVERLLVATGGADASGTGARVAARLAGELVGVEVRLAVGPWTELDDPPPGVTLVRTTSGLGAELAAADLVVTGGGVTMLEALALGRPTVALILAENQRRAVTAAARSRAVLPVDRSGCRGVDLVRIADEVAAATATLAADTPMRASLAATAARLVDGRGASRVAEVVLAP
jgi:spore coat polysaccharide biosynthesis predicted glycosyltransferase SpsG